MGATRWRCAVVAATAVLTLTACDGGDSSQPSSSAPSTSPALPTATGSASTLALGRPLWTSTGLRLPRADTAALSGDTAVLLGVDGVAAVAARTGRVLWSHRADGPTAALGEGSTADVDFSPFVLVRRASVTPAVAGTGPLVLLGYARADGRTEQGLAALSLRTGTLVWRVSYGNDRTGVPSVGVVGSSATHVLVSVTPQRGPEGTQPAVARTVVLDTASGRTVREQRGLLAWQLSGDTVVGTDVRGQDVPADPNAMSGPIVGVAAATGRELWRAANPSGDGRITSATDRTVMVNDTYGTATLLDTRTGATLWRSRESASCASDDHRLVACSTDGRLVSWATDDPVVRVSSRPVDGVVRRVEAGRVFARRTGVPEVVVDVSGRPLLRSPLQNEVLAATNKLALLTDTLEYSPGAVSARTVDG